MTSLSLESFISLSSQQGNLQKRFLEVLINNGGRSAALEKLLQDANNGGEEYLKKLAQMLVGDIWARTEKEIDLGDIDFDCSPSEFTEGIPGVYHSDPSVGWVDTKPKGPCKYSLRHFERPMSFEEMENISFGENEEGANWRELVVYVSKFQEADFCDCVICATGSILQPDIDGQRFFPEAVWWEGTIPSRVSVKPDRFRPNNPQLKFTPNNFWLVRVYPD